MQNCPVDFWANKKIKRLLKKLAYRWYEAQEDFEITLVMRDGLVIKYKVKKGFRFDSRSGGRFVDLFLPHMGSEKFIICWLIHDINGYGKYFSFDDTNTILYEMLTIAGATTIQVNLAHAVGANDFWYGDPEPDEKEYHNIEHNTFDIEYRANACN